MEEGSAFAIGEFVSFTIGIVVFFLGAELTRRWRILRDYNIPEPVSGGLAAAVVTLFVYWWFDISVTFDLTTRDALLVYFFTAIGLNARFSDLIAGGKPLLIMLGLTLTFMVLQNVIGLIGVTLFDLPSAVSVLAGTASLIGGHGTAIAWAPEIAQDYNVPNAIEIGVACATFGLILASLIGGPIAKYLISKNNLSPDRDSEPVAAMPYETEEGPTIDHVRLMAALLALNLAIVIGYLLNSALTTAGLRLPLFVSCLLVAIVMSNTIPRLFTGMKWPARTPALALISEYSLSIFLAMSLMSMQLWTLAGLAGPLLGILALQSLAAFVFIIFVLFRAMGSNYDAAVLGAGFGGFTLGATPTAIANMTAVTKKHGPSPLAFLILPLVSAFFVDLANAFLIGWFLSL